MRFTDTEKYQLRLKIFYMLILKYTFTLIINVKTVLKLMDNEFFKIQTAILLKYS